jgi:hypothetical protein
MDLITRIVRVPVHVSTAIEQSIIEDPDALG